LEKDGTYLLRWIGMMHTNILLFLELAIVAACETVMVEIRFILKK